MNQKKQNILSLIALAAFAILGILFLSIKSIVGFVTDIMWFEKMDYLTAFLVRIKTEIFIFVPLTLIIGFGLYFYLKSLKKRYYHSAHIFYNAKADKKLHLAIGGFSTVLSIIVSLLLSRTLWVKVQMFLNRQNFDIKDPIFNKDVGFYVFNLPFYHSILNGLIALSILVLIITVFFFFVIITLRESSDNELDQVHFLNPQDKMKAYLNNPISETVFRKVAYIGALVFFLLGIINYLKGYELMYSTSGVVFGASYTDIHVTLVTYRVLMVAAFLFSGLFLFFTLKQKRKITYALPIVFISISIIGSGIGLFVQNLVVEPDEINKEKAYLEYNINNTLDAFKLKDVTIKTFDVSQKLTYDNILENDSTIKNIRINDTRPLTQTYNQLQGIRLYYNFSGIDLDRYLVDNEYRQVFVAARELDQNLLSPQARTWINQHLKYTHGYGVVMSPVNEVTPEGQPEFFIENIPPLTTTDLIITQPEIYFGESSDQYIIVDTTEDEFDYPSGSDNKTTRYQGEAGLSLSGINRMLFSLREQSMKLFVSSVITEDSKIIIYRNINERIKKIAPFLTFDNDPYLVLNQEDGKLYWIIDGYTTTSYYPYSEQYLFQNDRINYIRNSVKVVVDAYEGTTDFYKIDTEDPILMAYDAIFKGLFKDIKDFPKGLEEHIKYPQDFFDLQTEVYRSYHVSNPEVFYNGEDLWDVSNEKYMEDVQKMASNYVMFKLPDGEKEEFALMIPYTPKEKANMNALLVARNDADVYGDLFLYQFPKDRTIQGPMMIESRIDQDSEISSLFTLWSQQGSRVLRGNVIIVPIENALLYVEPIYLQADNENALPEMKRVIIAYEDEIVISENLETSLQMLFGQASIPTDSSTENPNINLSPELIDQINRLNRLLENSKTNLNEIESILDDINKLLNADE